MMMRSMPPASSHLADSPVPAPPPTMGTRRRTISRNLSRIAVRSMRGIRLASVCDGTEILHQGGGEFRIVDVVGQPDQLPFRRPLDGPLQCVEQRGVGFRIVE